MFKAKENKIKKEKLIINTNNIEQFHRKNITRQLAQLIKKVVS